jgi:putrescine carbamoyltransferase
MAEDNCRAAGGSLTITDDVEDAVRQADYLYTDLWWWVGQEAEIPERREAFMPRYQVNEALLRRAPPQCKFMHCLPASRGVEVTDAVMDSAQSIIFDQSENRLHTEKALLVWFLLPQMKAPSRSRQRAHTRAIEAFLDGHPLKDA